MYIFYSLCEKVCTNEHYGNGVVWSIIVLYRHSQVE